MYKFAVEFRKITSDVSRHRLVKKKTHDPSQWGMNFCKIHIYLENLKYCPGDDIHTSQIPPSPIVWFISWYYYSTVCTNEFIKRHFVVFSVYTYKSVRVIWIPLIASDSTNSCTLQKRKIFQKLKTNRKINEINGMKMSQYIAQLCSATRILVCFGTKRFGSNNPHCT
jgi:hypothetical protein